MIRTLALLLVASAGLIAGQNFYGDSPDSGDDVITARDARGDAITAYNLYDGHSHGIKVTRSNARGGVLWSQKHSENLYEKAYDAALDSSGNAYIAGVRKLYERKFFLLIKFTRNGHEEWSRADDQYDCTAVGVVVDGQNDILVAGVCRHGPHNHPARLVKYNADGARLWAQEYDGGGRNYVRGLHFDGEGNLSLSIETIFGNYRDGSYETRTVLYDRDGRQLEVR
ncbi:hypothetical protein ACFL2T_03395 [Elusimicrobiota bacterium]